jgi:hypothetical protein
MNEPAIPEQALADLLSANSLVWIQGKTACRWLSDAERDLILRAMCSPAPQSLVGVERSAPPLRAREEIAQCIWNGFGRMGGDFDNAKGTVAYEHCCGVADDILALSSTAGQEWREPEGWQFVPKTMTPRMEDAFHDAFPRRENADHPNDRDKPRYNALGDHTQLLDELWTALLAAAPPVAEPIVADQRQPEAKP